MKFIDASPGWLGVCLLFVAFAWSAPAVVPAAPIDQLGGGDTTAPEGHVRELDAAIKAFRRGKIEICRELLDAAREKVPGLPPTDLMLSRLYISHDKPAAGRALLEKVAVEHKGHPEVYLLFGNVALDEGRLTDALLHFERSLQVSIPARWTRDQRRALLRASYDGQAKVAERREDWFVAQVALKQLVNKVEPNDAGFRDRLGVALFMLGREQEAFDQFKTSARLDPEMNHPEVSMAVMYARQQKYSKAEQAFKTAAEKYPDDGRVHYEWSGVLLTGDRAEEAREHAAKAAELGVDTIQLDLHRGYIARQLERYEEAERHFSSVLEKSPSHFEAMNQLALVMVEQQDDAKRGRALELATLNARRFRDSSYALSTLGWVYYKLGRFDQAEQALKLAAVKPRVRSETYYFLTRVLWEHGDRAEALQVAERVKSALDRPGLFVLRPHVKQWIASEAIN